MMSFLIGFSIGLYGTHRGWSFWKIVGVSALIAVGLNLLGGVYG